MRSASERVPGPGRNSKAPVAPGNLEVPLSLVNGNGDGNLSSSVLSTLVADASRLADQGRAAAAFELIERELANEGGHAPTGARAALLVEAARILWLLGRYEESLARGRRGLTLAELDGNGRLAADALLRLGLSRHRLGDLAGAREFYEEARARFRRLGSESRAAAAHNNLGLVTLALGDWDGARYHYRQAIDLARLESTPAVLGARLQNLGTLELKSGEWARARATLKEARTCFVEGDHRWGMATNTIALGLLARLEGRLEEAASLAHQAMTIALAESMPREEAIALELTAQVAADRGDLEGAIRLDERALEIAERIAPRSDLACELLRQLGGHALRLGELGRAAGLLERARQLATELGDRYELSLVERLEAERALARGDREDAERGLLNAAGVLGELGERVERGRCFALLARLAATPEESCRWGFRASACFAEAGAEREVRDIEELVTGRLRGVPEASSPSAPPEAPKLVSGRRGRVELIGSSRAFSRVRVQVSRVARHNRPVLLRGETGTGKSLIARAIHERSQRSGGPLVIVRCHEIPRDRLLIHLFGDGRSPGGEAGRLERAEGGTLYLDEVGALPLAAQSGLLRYLQRGTYIRPGELTPRPADVRIIAATSLQLRSAAGEAGFRRDLLAQFANASIQVPSLRARREDVLPLARHFMKLHARGGEVRLDEDAALRLLEHPWFENVRELEECMREARIETEGGRSINRATIDRLLDRADPAVEEDQGDSATDAGGEEATLLGARIAELERQKILRALAQARGNKTRASITLGIARKTLYERLRRFGIPVDEVPR